MESLERTLLARRPAALLIAAMALAVAGFTPLESLFAPRSVLWERWTAHDTESTASIDHAAWDRLLEAYVVPGLVPGANGVNRFAYRRVTDADTRALADYTEDLSRIPISRYRRDEQRAYWINFYNALTVKVVLDHYPVATIRDIDISPGFFAVGPWDRKLVNVEGEAISLNDIEHRILRPIWRDARVHYAVNCAAVGCPNLEARAFSPANTEALLDAAAGAYVNHPRGARFENGILTVSKIYAWFAADFGSGEADVIRHLKRYAEPGLAARLQEARSIGGYDYDWSLNE